MSFVSRVFLSAAVFCVLLVACSVVLLQEPPAAPLQPDALQALDPAPAQVLPTTQPTRITAQDNSLPPFLQLEAFRDEAVAQQLAPIGLSQEGKTAYDNFAGFLLTADEVNVHFDPPTWTALNDSPGLHRSCRVFVNAADDSPVFPYFFNCVYLIRPDFNLLDDDTGFYEVIQAYQTAYSDETSSVVLAYLNDDGLYGIDRLSQVDCFVFATGLAAGVFNTDALFGAFSPSVDRFLFETNRAMIRKAQNAPPIVLEFSLETQLYVFKNLEDVLIREGDLGSGEPDLFTGEGVCRTLYHVEGPPPVLVNCVYRKSNFTPTAWLARYLQKDFLDIILETRFSYLSPYTIFLDFTDGGNPRYALLVEKGELFIGVDLVMPWLTGGVDPGDSFTAPIDSLLYEIFRLNQERILGEKPNG